MPDKEGSDDEKKSTKSVVNKKQKQMMGEEGYDHLRDQGRIRKNKKKKDATTMPPSKEMEKTRKVYKGPSALELVKKKYKGQIMDVKKEELDLTQVAKAFGGYIIESEIDDGFEDETTPKTTSKPKKVISKKKSQGPKITGDVQTPKLTVKPKPARVINRMAKNIAKSEIEQSGDKFVGGANLENLGKKRKKTLPTDPGQLGKAGKVTSYNPRKGDKSPKAEADKKQRISDTLRKAKQTDIKGGPSVKRGDPVPQEEIPTKKKPVPEIGGYQFNTFKDSEMKKRKTFKQAFGQPTGADPKTGKPTYMRPGALDKDGKPRPAQKRSKNLPDYDTVKTAVDMGLNPDEIDKNKFIDQEVRNTRTDRLGTPDPDDPDYDKKVKKVDQRTKIARAFKTPKFQTAQRPLEVDRETSPDPEKIASDIKKTGIKFKDFDKKLRDAKVDADIERTIAGKNTRVSQTQVVGGGGGGNRNRTRTGTGTPDNPEVMKNGSAKNMIDVTNVKEPSKMSQAKDNARDFAKKDPVAALATYDLGKGLLGKILKTRLPRVPTPRAIQVSAKS